MSDIGKKDDEQLANEIGERALAQVAREELAQVEDIRARRNSHKWLRDEKQSPDGNDGRWSCEDDIQILLNCLDRAIKLRTSGASYESGYGAGVMSEEPVINDLRESRDTFKGLALVVLGRSELRPYPWSPVQEIQYLRECARAALGEDEQVKDISNETTRRTVMDVEKIAIVCHETNASYCRTIGDDSQVPWFKAPQWQRDSAISGVKAAMAGGPPDASHVNWLKDKEADGWKYGPVKNAEKKEHPCMVPYADLPEEQKRKDHLFIAVVRALTGSV